MAIPYDNAPKEKPERENLDRITVILLLLMVALFSFAAGILMCEVIP